MNDLPPADQTALLLRFFESRSHADVGVALGLSENAARMRVDRAPEKLRGALARRGITSTAAAIGGALATHAVAAAPESLAAGVAAYALAGASALAASGIAAPVSVALTFMSTTKLIGAAAAALALFAAGGYLGVRYGNATAARDVGDGASGFGSAHGNSCPRAGAASALPTSSAPTARAKAPQFGTEASAVASTDRASRTPSNLDAPSGEVHRGGGKKM